MRSRAGSLAEGWEAVQPGLRKALLPALAGARMGLRPQDYTDEDRGKVYEQIKLQSTDEAIHGGFLADQRRMAVRSEAVGKKQYLDSAVTTREAVPPSAMANWVKDLRLSYPHLLSRHSQKLNAFLNSFVSAANLHKIGLEQLTSVFPHFFDDSLQQIIIAELERFSLPKVIENLRGHLCTATTLTQCSRSIRGKFCTPCTSFVIW